MAEGGSSGRRAPARARHAWVLAAMGMVLAVAGCGGGDEDDGQGNARGEGLDRPVKEAGPDAPNIVVVMTDDQDLASIEVMPTVRHEIINEGVEFTNSFVALSECCPSRATFLTGQHAHNHEVETSKPPKGGYPRLDSANTLPVWLRDAGYRTGQVGRYLNYYGNPKQGTDPLEVPPGWDDWHVPVEHTEFQMYGYTLNENGELVDYGDAPSDYQTDVFAERAVEFIESSSEGADPFFLWVTPLAPHSEGVLDDVVEARRNPRPAPRDDGAFEDEEVPQPPSFGEPDESDKPDVVREAANLPSAAGPDPTLEGEYRGRLESLLAVDRMVGEIVAALRRTGELEDTYLVFTSDNGYLLGEHRQVGKHLVFEESIRVPLAIRGPGVEAGETRPEPVQNVDLAPTITELAGVRAQRVVDGVPLLGPGPLDPDRDLFVSYPQSALAYDAVRSADGFTYAEYEAGDVELYDLNEDPFQLENVAEDPAYAEARDRLAARLEELRGCAGDDCR
jgi:N-acetylglucosamine-6-sulfatase